MTTKGPASEGVLGDLHNKVAKVMINALDKIIESQETIVDPVEEAVRGDVNPALLSVMVKFLDSNKITCAPEAGNTMSELEQKLAEKAQKRRKIGNVTYLDPTDE